MENTQVDKLIPKNMNWFLKEPQILVSFIICSRSQLYDLKYLMSLRIPSKILINELLRKISSSRNNEINEIER
jgi:hypothetical protein